MNNNELFLFLGKCLTISTHAENKQDVIQRLQNEQIDWLKFLKLANDHLVIPSLYIRFKQNDLLSLIPTQLAEHIEYIHKLNYERNLSIIKQIESINSILNKHNIIPVYLKGSGNILDKLYDDLGERIMGDIDFLVSDEEFETAANLLLNEGYKTEIQYHTDEKEVTKHYPRMFHENWQADVEVHLVPVEVRYSKQFNYTIISTEKRTINIYNTTCCVLSDKHKLIQNFIHGFLSYDVQLNISYRNMFDFYLISNRINTNKIDEIFDYKQAEAKSYISIINNSFNINQNDYQSGYTILYRLSKIRYIGKSIWYINYFSFRFNYSYLHHIKLFFTNKGIRKHIIRSLANPKWYVSHIKSYQKTIKQNS
jgi:hypothetical protein